ncbi:MAG: hypothetical protein ACI9OJ_001649 [Myxococcota bacterium]|jgi:hypothetical protein
MTALLPTELASFRTRFHDGGDGLIRRINYDFARRTADIVIAIVPPGEDWMNLRLSLRPVSAWRAAHTNTSHHQVLSDGFSLLHDAGWYLDLAPDFSQAPSATAIQSNVHVHVK